MTRKWFFSGDSKLPAVACLLLGAILLLCPTDRSISRADSVPDWLAAAGRVDLGHFGDGSAAVVIGDWKDFSVDASGTFVLTERRAMRVLNRRAADRHVKAVAYENNDVKVVSIQTWSVSPSGRVTQSGKKDMVTEAGYSAFGEFTDVRMKMINTPGAEDGTLIGSEIVTQGRLLISGKKFQMEEEIPVRQTELHVSVPAGSMRWFANFPDRVEVSNESPTGATFRSENRTAIPDETNAPAFSSLAAEVIVNYDPKGSGAVKSWEEAGHAYHVLFDNGEKPEAALASQVDSLSTGKADELSKLDSLYTFVSRQIRYVAIEIGIGGYQPRPAADVYANKYGDCKDKANLLISMLGKIGLRAYPALVGTRDDIEADPKAPTLATFDHMIVAFPVPETLRPAVEKFSGYDSRIHILWMDPTSERDPLGQLPEMDQGVFALIAYPDHGDLQRIPETPPELNGTQYNAQVLLKADGSGTADVEIKYLGSRDAVRHEFYRGKSESEMVKFFEERVTRYVNQAVFRKGTVSGIDDNRQQIAERFSFSGDFSAASTGDSWFLQPLFLTGIAVPEVGPRPRKLPLDIGPPERITGEYRVELPADMRIERVPDDVSIKSEFGEMKVEYTASANRLLAKQTLVFTQSRIAPEKYPEFRDFVNGFLRAERQRLRVVKQNP